MSFRVDDPWQLHSDSGPLIDAEAHDQIAEYVATARKEGRVLHQTSSPEDGHFLSPTLIRVAVDRGYGA